MNRLALGYSLSFFLFFFFACFNLVHLPMYLILHRLTDYLTAWQVNEGKNYARVKTLIIGGPFYVLCAHGCQASPVTSNF